MMGVDGSSQFSADSQPKSLARIVPDCVPGCGAAAADRRLPAVQQSINICCPPRRKQQTRSGVRRPDRTGQTDRRTERRTPNSYIDPAAHTVRSVRLSERVARVRRRQLIVVSSLLAVSSLQHNSVSPNHLPVIVASDRR